MSYIREKQPYKCNVSQNREDLYLSACVDEEGNYEEERETLYTC